MATAVSGLQCCARAALLARLASHAAAGCSSSTAAAPSAAAAAAAAAVGPTALAAGLRAFGSKPPSKTKPAAASAGAYYKKGAPREGADEGSPVVRTLVELLSPPDRKPLPLSAEDEARLAAAKQAQVVEYHAWVKDMAVKHKLQRAALRALPERLRVAAMQPDHRSFPLNRKFYFDTPPEAYRDRVEKGRGGEGGKQ